MPPDANNAQISSRWIKNAKSDLVLASIELPDGACFEHLCFHAQQAVEKSLKAVLISYDIEFPYTHDIQKLFDLMPVGLSVPIELYKASSLTPYAATTRYPDEAELVSEDEWHNAVALAEVVFAWASEIIQSH